MEDPTTQERFQFMNPLVSRAIYSTNRPKVHDIFSKKEDDKLNLNDTAVLGKRKHSNSIIAVEAKKFNLEIKNKPHLAKDRMEKRDKNGNKYSRTSVKTTSNIDASIKDKPVHRITRKASLFHDVSGFIINKNST